MAKNLEKMMEDLVVIQKNQMSSDELVRARIARSENMILGLDKQYRRHDLEIVNIKDRMDNLELNEEITDEQVRTIQSRVKKRVSEVLNYPHGDSSKYYRTFISDIYANLRRNYQLGSRIATTRKKHFDTVIKGIEAWGPDVNELKRKKDQIDNANKLYQVK